jgi:hypoxanthine phosphoribosyltransferase
VPDIQASGRGRGKVRLILLGGLAEDAGTREIAIEASSWREALVRAREELPVLRQVLDEKGNPKPGYLVFVDGVDYRLVNTKNAGEVVILPVNHGGAELLYVSWEEIEELSAKVARLVLKSGFNVDVIVGIMRGGIIPARIIADQLGVDRIEVLEVKLYRGVGVRGEKPYVIRPVVGELKGLNVLIVDDISDSGLTLESALNFVSLYAPRGIRTATLFIKPWTRLVPDYYAETTDKWVVFPWEKKETERELAQMGG